MTEPSTEPQVGPVVKVARDLREIEDMALRLENQAEHKANDPEMPGGSAMVALGHVANLEAWENLNQATERYGKPYTSVAEEDPNWEPPLQTLRFWSEQWRIEHGYENDQWTIASEANFIRYLLDWAWDNEPQWDDFARDIKLARLRLEDILYAGRRAERSRVPCIAVECERHPRLIRVYRDRAHDDGYRCPSCKTWYDADAYLRAKMNLLASQGADRHVKAQDAREAVGRPERTFRKWLRFWHVRSYRDESGQTWVWWPDVRETHLATQQRQIRKSA